MEISDLRDKLLFKDRMLIFLNSGISEIDGVSRQRIVPLELR